MGSHGVSSFRKSSAGAVLKRNALSEWFARLSVCCVVFAGCTVKHAASQRVAEDGSRAPDSGAARSALTLAARLDLHDEIGPTGATIRLGTFEVPENRGGDETSRSAEPSQGAASQTVSAKSNSAIRRLKLDVVVLSAKKRPARPDPVFAFAGGPGQNVAGHVDRWDSSWINADRDIVLVSQRGTGGDNRLTCELAGSDDNLQGYFERMFDETVFRACLDELSKRFDLTQYSTNSAVDDVDELRLALGYGRINLIGGSYGSRAELVFMRRHPDAVRCAIMNSVAPIAFRNPLYHSRAAQDALDAIFAASAADPDCHAAFGDLTAKFKQIVERFEQGPVPATVRHPETGAAQTVRLSFEAFGESLRVAMYYDHRDVPLMIQRAWEGNFDLLAQRGLEGNRGLRQELAFGMLLCVTCTEDLARIRPDEIESATRGTFLRDFRVRSQMQMCRFWPKSDLEPNFGEAVSASIPTLLLSGSLDPVTPPKWGQEAARHLSNATHVVAPGSHGVGGECIDSIVRSFLENPEQALDTRCVTELTRTSFRLVE
jgi:pimeloyl-ACP methyl ester carboxylesterase